MAVEKCLEMWLKNSLVSAQIPIQCYANLITNYYYGNVIVINLFLYLISLLSYNVINNALDSK